MATPVRKSGAGRDAGTATTPTPAFPGWLPILPHIDHHYAAAAAGNWTSAPPPAPV